MFPYVFPAWENNSNNMDIIISGLPARVDAHHLLNIKLLTQKVIIKLLIIVKLFLDLLLEEDGIWWSPRSSKP
jgi:hypothetical protein